MSQDNNLDQDDLPTAEEPELLDDRYAPLMEVLGYQFSNLTLLRRALTHRSHANEHAGEELHNERLEFLGDAVVGLCVGYEVMQRLPNAREGQLTKVRASVVSENGLSAAAQALKLGDYLRLGHGEEQGGGRAKASILSDAFEALVGAIFVDGGFEVVASVLGVLLGDLVQAGVRGDLDRDFKTRLQERFASQGELLRYEVVGERGPDHAKIFEVAACLGERELGRAEGHSKKEAEQRAAEGAFAALAIDALAEDEPVQGRQD